MNSISPCWQTVCLISELVPGRFIEFQIQGGPEGAESRPLNGFVFLDSDNSPRAYLNICPHLGIELNWMPGRFMDTDNLFIQCATHGALFKPSTGECITGPCQGDALTALEVRQKAGQVEIRVAA